MLGFREHASACPLETLADIRGGACRVVGWRVLPLLERAVERPCDAGFPHQAMEAREFLRAAFEFDDMYGLAGGRGLADHGDGIGGDRKSTRLNSSHMSISYAV